MRSLKLFFCLSTQLLITLSFVSSAEETKQLVVAESYSGSLTPSLRNEVNAAIGRGLKWLAKNQKDDGSWSNPQFPSLTALPLIAFLSQKDEKNSIVVSNAIKFILSNVRDDGGIYANVEGQKGGGLPNYNTAICMTALHATGNPELVPYVLKAREFIAGAQHFGADEYRGGFGYDAKTQRPYADLLNTFYAVEAMHVTAGAEEFRPKDQKRADINWAETVKFIEKMQNKNESGKDEAGGFFYKPGESKAGITTNSQGIVVFRSYGSITYAGLLALIYANVTKEDARVRSAFQWATEHWTLDENPGMGQEGLYFFYNVLTKAMDTYGVDSFPSKNKGIVNWRKEVAEKLVSLQKIEPETGFGFWVNENGRFWENDPVLVTAYSIIALQRL